jgi:hypothetical protein
MLLADDKSRRISIGSGRPFPFSRRPSLIPVPFISPSAEATRLLDRIDIP